MKGLLTEGIKGAHEAPLRLIVVVVFLVVAVHRDSRIPVYLYTRIPVCPYTMRPPLSLIPMRSFVRSSVRSMIVENRGWKAGVVYIHSCSW